MTAKDAALREFDGHVLRLAQIINRAEPERFARTSVSGPRLAPLSRERARLYPMSSAALGAIHPARQAFGAGKTFVFAVGTDDTDKHGAALAPPAASGKTARRTPLWRSTRAQRIAPMLLPAG